MATIKTKKHRATEEQSQETWFQTLESGNYWDVVDSSKTFFLVPTNVIIPTLIKEPRLFQKIRTDIHFNKSIFIALLQMFTHKWHNALVTAATTDQSQFIVWNCNRINIIRHIWGHYSISHFKRTTQLLKFGSSITQPLQNWLWRWGLPNTYDNILEATSHSMW